MWFSCLGRVVFVIGACGVFSLLSLCGFRVRGVWSSWWPYVGVCISCVFLSLVEGASFFLGIAIYFFA